MENNEQRCTVLQRPSRGRGKESLDGVRNEEPEEQ